MSTFRKISLAAVAALAIGAGSGAAQAQHHHHGAQTGFLGDERKAELPHKRSEERFARDACWIVKMAHQEIEWMNLMGNVA